MLECVAIVDADFELIHCPQGRILYCFSELNAMQRAILEHKTEIYKNTILCFVAKPVWTMRPTLLPLGIILWYKYLAKKRVKMFCSPLCCSYRDKQTAIYIIHATCYGYCVIPYLYI